MQIEVMKAEKEKFESKAGQLVSPQVTNENLFCTEGVLSLTIVTL